MKPNKGQLFCSEFYEKMSEKLSDKSVLQLIEYVMPESDNEGYLVLQGKEDDIYKAMDAITKASNEAGYDGRFFFGGDENWLEAQMVFTKKSK